MKLTKYKRQLKDLVMNQTDTKRILVKIYWLLIGFMQIVLDVIEEMDNE